MFSIFKKKASFSIDLSPLQADMHSHLLPGIDDGSPDTATSLRLIQGLKDLGYSRLITTPHILWDVYKNDAGTISRAFTQLEATGIDTPLRTAAEYFLDDHFDQLLQTGTPLLPVKNNWILVELSFVSPSLDVKEKLFNMQIKGYQPVLAHPERYAYFAAARKWYDELKDMGCLFQLNLLSLAGHYGKLEMELAHYLIKKQYIDLLGTDVHHERHLHVLRSSHQIMSSVQTLLDSGRILNPSL